MQNMQQQQPQAFQALQWEYRMFTFQPSKKTELADTLARAGRYGWELVSLTPVANTLLVAGDTSELIGVFKRLGTLPAEREDEVDPNDWRAVKTAGMR